MTDWLNRTHVGDCRELLKAMAADGVRAQTCVTSPPYFGLRNYGVEGQIGLETSPAEYVEGLVSVFRLVRDVLAKNGTAWLILGDSYANDGKWGGSSGGKHAKALHGKNSIGRGRRFTGAKPKDLLGIPWRVAFALQADGRWLRSDIIWSKPNPLPERVTDRPTKSHEYVFLLAKSERYYFDATAIKEPATDTGRLNGVDDRDEQPEARPPGTGPRTLARIDYSALGRNKRTVWTVPVARFPSAHFATFPRELMEACGSAHFWARKLIPLGHTVKLMAPQFVKPYVKSNKNDARDAEAICKAVARPNMRFVALKTIEQQDLLGLNRARQRFVTARTAQSSQIRGLLTAFGIVMPKGISSLERRMREILEDAENGLPGTSARHPRLSPSPWNWCRW